MCEVVGGTKVRVRVVPRKAKDFNPAHHGNRDVINALQHIRMNLAKVIIQGHKKARRAIRTSFLVAMMFIVLIVKLEEDKMNKSGGSMFFYILYIM